MSIVLSGVSAGYGRNPSVVENIDLEIRDGEITVFIGPNGCGKSTLLKTMARLLKPRSGRIEVDGLDVLSSSPKAVARTLAFLPQEPLVPTGISVEQMVGYGRAPHQSLLGFRSARDVELINQAIATVGIEHLRDRPVAELSGGQRQSAFFAMVLAQDTPYAILDEPTNHLDITHQIDVLERIRRLNSEHQKTTLVVLHDLNLAARYADRLVLFKDGAIYADGTPEQVLTPANIAEVFAVDSRILTEPVGGKPLCVPYPQSVGATQR
ncbi:ABC transporter ATP-binding protein [Saccharospirillum mangrovi]|uniref:ABC transporter ATP-binding protein n=1 Tax=Saccharospirillum mangrovi TaxID=2161747 RepID=UPI000D3BF32E|nr:ABC transporter ATP-binding protein [Saccharospirillum mangrovi]